MPTSISLAGFLNGVEVGEIHQVAQLHFLEADTGADETFRMADVVVAGAVIDAHIGDLRKIVLQQPLDEALHARRRVVGGARNSPLLIAASASLGPRRAVSLNSALLST